MRLVLLLLLLATPLPSQANEQVKIIDGDGFEMQGTIYRLWGIDAPEYDQVCENTGEPYACGRSATAFLENLISDKKPVCEWVDEDRHGRIIARCSVDGEDLGAMMVLQGWAVDYDRLSHGAYRPEEDVARAAKRGLWAGAFLPPGEWRRRAN